MHDENEEIELDYRKRDYGFHVSNIYGYATILVLHDTSNLTYNILALAHGKTYSASFPNLESARSYLNKLFNHPRGHHELYSVQEDRRVNSLCSRLYRWMYAFFQC